jgi:hypothetical protein
MCFILYTFTVRKKSFDKYLDSYTLNVCWNAYVFVPSVLCCCSVLPKTEKWTEVLLKLSRAKTYKTPHSGTRIVICGQASRHGKANWRTSPTFRCESSKKMTSSLEALVSSASVSAELNMDCCVQNLERSELFCEISINRTTNYFFCEKELGQE